MVEVVDEKKGQRTSIWPVHVTLLDSSWMSTGPLPVPKAGLALPVLLLPLLLFFVPHPHHRMFRGGARRSFPPGVQDDGGRLTTHEVADTRKGSRDSTRGSALHMKHRSSTMDNGG